VRWANVRQCVAQLVEPLPHRDAVIQEKAADLIDDRGPLSHQAIAHAMQRLQIELLIGFGGTHRVVGRCTASATSGIEAN
jgi:hypothetical protein